MRAWVLSSQMPYICLLVQAFHTPPLYRDDEGAHNFLGNSANADLICQAKGELGQALVPTPTLETNKHTF